jgi:dihydrodipicolinate synthase/N-acetylneuraminate lyase
MNGIVTVLNTPFTASGEIDFGGLRGNVADALEAEVSGFLVGGLASEVGVLTEDERVAILETVLDVSDGVVPVIGGAFGATQGDRVAVARRLIEGGCNGVMASVPYVDEVSFTQDVRELAGLKPEFLMIQDWDPTGAGIPVSTIAELHKTIPEFTWLKIEVIPAGPKYTEVLDASGGSLKVAGGWAVMQMIEALDRGVHAFMPTAMHKIYTTLYRRYAAGDREGARDLFEAILPVLAFSNQSLDISILFFKRLLATQGVFETSAVRVTCPSFDDAQKRIADELIAKVMGIEASLEK